MTENSIIWSRLKNNEKELYRSFLVIKLKVLPKISYLLLILSSGQTNTDAYAKCVDPDEMTCNKLSHQGLH